MHIAGLRTLSPSSHSPWQDGSADALTAAQETRVRGITPAQQNARIRKGLPPYHCVRLPLAPKPGDQGERRYTERRCPVLNRSRNGERLLVIAPDGSDQWVDFK